jgi:pimeloyl-ACP methyl ester carboxylesterase
MGGFISQGVAIKFPNRVEKLVLVSTAPEERFINPVGGGWISEGTKLEERMRTYFAPGFVERNPVLFKTMVTQIRQSIEGTDFSQRSDMQRAALRGAGWHKDLGKIEAPTLIIHGKEDLVIDLEGAEKLRESIVDSQLIIIPSAGHLLLAEAPKELYRIVQQFLSK